MNKIDQLRMLKNDKFVIIGNNVKMERRYNTLTVSANINLKHKTADVEGKITGIGWVAALLFAPLGTVYYFFRKGSRVSEMKGDIEDVLG